MTKTEIAKIITAAGLNPANYRTARAAAILTTWIDGKVEDGDDTALATADLWETLGGNQDETVPRTQEAADAAWDVADSLTEANGFGGVWAA